MATVRNFQRGVARINQLLSRQRWPRIPGSSLIRLFNPRVNTSAGSRRVKLICGACGKLVAHVDEVSDGARFADYPDLRLIVRVGDCGYRFLRPAAICPRHGQLDAKWTDVLPRAHAAARDGRARTLRARPISAPS